MAYRRYGRRRRYRRRRPRRAPGQSGLGYALSTASKALAIAKFAKNALNVEYKNVDTSIDTTVGTTAAYTLLNGLAQGDSESSRDGEKVRFKSLQVRGQLKQGASATAAQTVHFYLVIDKQTNGLAPDSGSIFETDSDVFSLRNTTYMKRYVVLRDWLVNLDDVGREQQTIKFYTKMNMPTMYIGTGSTVGNITTNSLYLVAVSDDNTNPPEMDLSIRLRYIDN